MSDQLKACPFKHAKMIEVEVRANVEGAAVVCPDCGAQGPFAGNEAEASKLWNTRAEWSSQAEGKTA